MSSSQFNTIQFDIVKRLRTQGMSGPERARVGLLL
jgi:hypothetical protein